MDSQVLSRDEDELEVDGEEIISSIVEDKMAETDDENLISEVSNDESMYDDDYEKVIRDGESDNEGSKEEYNFLDMGEAPEEHKESGTEDIAIGGEQEQQPDQEQEGQNGSQQSEEEQSVKFSFNNLVDSDDDDIENLEAGVEERKGDRKEDLSKPAESTNTDSRGHHEEHEEFSIHTSDGKGLDNSINVEEYTVSVNEVKSKDDEDDTPYIELLSEDELEMESPVKNSQETDTSSKALNNKVAGETVVLTSDSEDEEEPNVSLIRDADENSNVLSVPIIIRIEEIDFLLVSLKGSGKQDVSHMVTLFEDDAILNTSVEGFFSTIRSNDDLKEIKHFEMNQELILEIPELGGIYITEDNIYSRDIMIEDFVRAFINLTENSKNDSEVPSTMSFHLNTQNRFVTDFNCVSELIRAGKGFKELKKISLNSSKKTKKHSQEDETLIQSEEKRRKINSSV